MTAPDPCLSVVILTEDKHGHATVAALARRMFDLIVPGYGSHRVDFIPREPREEEAMPGNGWKTDGKNPVEREKKIRLLRYLARRLSQPDTFVLFHVDGDRPWKDRATSENVAKFEHFAKVELPQVAGAGRAAVAVARARGQGTADAPPPPEMHAERLLLLCPFRSIEAWTYQNLRVAAEICRREHRGEHVAKLVAWETKRHELDELEAPDQELCLHKAHNRELASTGFPASEAYEVGKSFAATVDRLTDCDALGRALLRTRA